MDRGHLRRRDRRAAARYLSSIGLSWPPPGQQLYWQLWSIEVPGADYDQYTYRWNGSLHWEAYAADHAWVEFPP